MAQKSLGVGETPRRPIKVPDPQWSEFVDRCRKNGTTASAELRGHIEAYNHRDWVREYDEGRTDLEPPGYLPPHERHAAEAAERQVNPFA